MTLLEKAMAHKTIREKKRLAVKKASNDIYYRLGKIQAKRTIARLNGDIRKMNSLSRRIEQLEHTIKLLEDRKRNIWGF